MSFFSTASAVIRIIDWSKDKYENIKKWIVNKRRVYRSRKIRRIVDSDDTISLDKFLRNLKKRRRDRADTNKD